MKGLAEYYGFTPQEAGNLTIYQVCVLLPNDEDAEEPKAQKMSVTEYRRLVRGKI